jgi:hypothetical protein
MENLDSYIELKQGLLGILNGPNKLECLSLASLLTLM